MRLDPVILVEVPPAQSRIPNRGKGFNLRLTITYAVYMAINPKTLYFPLVAVRRTSEEGTTAEDLRRHRIHAIGLHRRGHALAYLLAETPLPTGHESPRGV